VIGEIQRRPLPPTPPTFTDDYVVSFAMLPGDKEFITRIQLSQLVTEDPYASDFYAQVYSAIARSKLAAQGAADPNAPSVLQVGADGRGLGVGIVRGAPGRTAGRLRDNAMQRMTMQVKRIVDNAKNRGMKPASGECSRLGCMSWRWRGGQLV
jgi:DNA topoisomerase 2-associated protein PAT1